MSIYDAVKKTIDDVRYNTGAALAYRVQGRKPTQDELNRSLIEISDELGAVCLYLAKWIDGLSDGLLALGVNPEDHLVGRYGPDWNVET